MESRPQGRGPKHACGAARVLAHAKLLAIQQSTNCRPLTGGNPRMQCCAMLLGLKRVLRQEKEVPQEKTVLPPAHRA